MKTKIYAHDDKFLNELRFPKKTELIETNNDEARKLCKWEDINYNYYVDEAKAIVSELEEPHHHLSEMYVREKIHHVLGLFDVLRNGLMRKNLPQLKEYWDKFDKNYKPEVEE